MSEDITYGTIPFDSVKAAREARNRYKTLVANHNAEITFNAEDEVIAKGLVNASEYERSEFFRGLNPNLVQQFVEYIHAIEQDSTKTKIEWIVRDALEDIEEVLRRTAIRLSENAHTLQDAAYADLVFKEHGINTCIAKPVFVPEPVNENDITTKPYSGTIYRLRSKDHE